MMARLIGRERTLHATRRAPAHTPDLIRYTTPRDTIRALTPLFWEHVRPYGEVRLDLGSRLTIGQTL